jgi:UDP:flavonoid glycosyltransferase YjiC (YdhE family)
MNIIIVAVGSLGDLHPYLGIGMELKRRHHEVTLVTLSHYQKRVEQAGLNFVPTRPDFSPNDKATLRLVNDRFRGGEMVFRKFVIPHIRESYEDLNRACENADLLISHPITQAAPIVAAKRKIPWISTVLSPISFFSYYDPPVMPALPFLHSWDLSQKFYHHLFNFIRWITDRWCQPVYELRQNLGLERGRNPIFEGQHSPDLVLALYSSLLGKPQPDWPPQTIMTGFLFYDEPNHFSPRQEELEKFLMQNEAPVVFTLGSSRIHTPGIFFEESLDATAQLGLRAVVIAGEQAEALRSTWNSASFYITDYLPYPKIFPRAKIIVHQGGIGTCGQALRAGKPMLIVPQAHDQPDNAHRLEKLGIAKSLPHHRYRRKALIKKLECLLQHYPSLLQKSEQIQKQILSENGVQTACDQIETYLRRKKQSL